MPGNVRGSLIEFLSSGCDHGSRLSFQDVSVCDPFQFRLTVAYSLISPQSRFKSGCTCLG